MKALFLVAILGFLSTAARAALIVGEVSVDCGATLSCTQLKPKFEALRDSYRNLTHLRQTLKVMVATGGVRDFRWELVDGVGPQLLRVTFRPKQTISSVKVISHDPQVKNYAERTLRLQSGTWFDDADLRDEELHVLQFLASKGYPRASIEVLRRSRGDDLALIFDIDPGRPQYLRRLDVKTDSATVRSFATQKFQQLLHKNYDIQETRLVADELEAELFSYGFFLSAVALTPKAEGEDVVVQALITPVEQWAFDIVRPPAPFVDVKIEFGALVRSLFKRYRRAVDEPMLRAGIAEELRKQGHLQPSIGLRMSRVTNHLGDVVNQARVEIAPGERTRLRKVSFPGAQHWREKELRRRWRAQASDQALAGYLDEESHNAFSDWLRSEYIKEGFVRAEVPKPRLVLDETGLEAELEYTVSEGSRVIVDDVTFAGVSEAEAQELQELIETRQGQPFNPIRFSEDVRLMQDHLQGQGWYDAEVVNRDADDIVSYGRDKTSVRINVVFRKGKLITFNRLLIVGAKVTRNSVIRRRSPFVRGEPITPALVREFETSVSSLGIFTTVKVRPVPHKGQTPLTDLAVEVTERDYGLIEIAPGFRTDLGLKLSGTVSWLNLLGENISSSLTGQVNRRIDLQALDRRRRLENKDLLEYSLTSQLNVPDVANSYIDYGLQASGQRRRFFSFDADIARLSNTISRDFGTRFSVSLRHQFESISQFDATNEDDNGSFEIGALTPSFTADFRNTRINPTAGAWFNVSNEFANPYFLSQNTEDLTINFYKLILRNRFYIPIPRGTIAISLVGGVQENLDKRVKKDSNGNPIEQDGVEQTRGYIPNIKLFRLTGTDIVRGFSDEEINRLPTGRDIGDARVQNRAYMANFKLEPRYFINDSLMMGAFLDAGRVYVDSFDAGELRHSVGVTFKVVTPVGTLDFDYGHKLLRKKNENGTLEAPGRFHVSIGFF